MIAIISPAKTLDFDPIKVTDYSLPRLPKQTLELIDVMRTKSPEDIKSLMSVSDSIAHLNTERYRKFAANRRSKKAKQSIYAFKGDVYLGLEAETLNNLDIDYAQNHLRILSGLYGLLRPLDLIQPYRLEMGTKLAFDDYNTLYSYWGDQIVDLVNKDLKKQGDNVLINLASNEYFKAVDRKTLKAQVVDVEFKDFNNGEYKIISFFAKKARGMMSQYLIKNRIETIDGLKGFNTAGYIYDESSSDDTKLAFKRG